MNQYLIICYDDGSIDGTLKTLYTYQEKYPNIVIIKNEKNNGIAFARQQLLNAVKTEYFYFVDADDIVTNNGLKKMHTAAHSNNADIVISKSFMLKKQAKRKINWFTSQFSHKTSLKYFINHNLFYLWNVLIKISFFSYD